MDSHTSQLPKLPAPLQWNELTQEPYIQLPAPFAHIRLTPPRIAADLNVVVENLNDPRVYQFLGSPPFPYTDDDARFWIGESAAECASILTAVIEGREWVDGCPVRSIREVQANGEEIYIGDISIFRERPVAPWITGSEPYNTLKPVGDPTILWSIGDWLTPTYHRRGIMSAVVGFLTSEWFIPRMNCRRMIATAFCGNSASTKVFLRNGWRQQEDFLEGVAVPESKGGGRRPLHIVRWNSDATE